MKKKLSQILESKTEIYTKKTKEQRLGDAPADPADQVKIGGKTEVGMNPTITGQQPFSQSTLKPLAMPHDAIEKLIDHYSKINAEHRREFINYLQKVFGDSAWAKPGAGVLAGTAEKNQKRLHKEEETELGEMIDEEFGELSPEFQVKAIRLFEKSVADRVANDGFRKKLAALLEDYSKKLGLQPSPFINDEKLDVVSALAENITELEGMLDLAENEKQRLLSDPIIRKQLTEDILYPDGKPAKAAAPKKSSVDFYLLEPQNEEDLFTEERSSVDPRMRKYLTNDGRLWGLPNGG
jgi:hypothetical protein